MMRAPTIVLLGTTFLASCAVVDVQASKEDLASGKADASELCASLGLEPGCDVCAELGWYDDDACDDFCSQPDPDCTPAEVPSTFECLAPRTLTSFDLTILDVGDEEGTVYVNDGGAPRTFGAQYDRVSSEGDGEAHRFVFGFDEHSAGEIDEPYAILIERVSFAFLRGSVEYDGQADELVCYETAALGPGEQAPTFECVALEEGSTLFDLDVVDVGDEEGTVVVNDGGAPITYQAEYDELSGEGGSPRHRFLFGFDEVGSGAIDEPYRIELQERSIDFATGQVDYDVIGSAGLVCHMEG